MKEMKTELTEQELRARLERLCRPADRLGRVATDAEAYVYGERKGRLWLGAYHASTSKSPGLAADRLNLRMHTEEDGRVTVSYRFGRHPALLIPYLWVVAVGIATAVRAVLGWIKGDVDAGSIPLFALFLMGFGAFGLYGKPAERRALEAHLRYLCGLDTASEETAADVPADGEKPQMADIADMEELYPLRLIFGGREYLTLYGYRASEEGERAVLLHGKGCLLCFRDAAQMRRFCEERGVETAGEPETVGFDTPITPNTPRARILNRWNRLSLMAEALERPFEGDEEAHGALYETLLASALPGAEGESEPLEDLQVEELEQVFGGQAELFAGFTLWRE